MPTWLRVIASLAGALSTVITVLLVQNLLERPPRMIRVGLIGALAFLLVWILTTPVVQRRRRFD